MRLCKLRLTTTDTVVGWIEENHIRILKSARISDILYAPNPVEALQRAVSPQKTIVPLTQAKFLAPIDYQEVWAAGVTYKRSQEARERESAGAARFYDLVYSAPRPELFFKAPPYRVANPGDPVHIRRDSKWNVPEPELALVISPELKLVGFTVGNDMSSRDIEGENPLYLPQAKFYDGACALGPCITLVDAMPKPDDIAIRLSIERAGQTVFDGTTSVSSMKRTFQELIDWLGRETSFPHGAILLTGTGIVPPDDFTLAVGDIVHIDIAGIGRLTNPVAMRK
ncbi:MAG TPA: fumarylacetoacetate hydrolase family protein [Gemmataceae bacterium]|nr:fumarylacetoacetate hydrolase family protein [Gemmataceae bacterium]